MHSLAGLVGMTSLAIKEKEINLEGPCYVHIAGRKSGLVDWLLNLCGVNTTSTLDVYADRIEYSNGSLSGEVREVIPLSQVSNLICGYFKPVILLVYAVLFCWTFIIPIICVVFYFLQKSTLISIIPASGSAVAIAFKRSLIENKNISEEEAQQIIQIINTLVENANSK